MEAEKLLDYADKDPATWSAADARFMMRKAAATIASLTSELDAGEVTYEVWQDDMPVAESDDIEEASHYASMYAQDGPIEVFRKRTTREKLAAIAGDKP